MRCLLMSAPLFDLYFPYKHSTASASAVAFAAFVALLPLIDVCPTRNHSKTKPVGHSTISSIKGPERGGGSPGE